MRAFRIEKSIYLRNILKACAQITKTRKSKPDIFTHIYYDAKNMTIFATNGWALLVYQTNEIITFLGDDIGNGTLTICGDFVIFEEETDALFNYLMPINKFEGVKKIYTQFSDMFKPYYYQAIVELALNGITMNPTVLKDLEPISSYLDYMTIQEDTCEAVMFSGFDDKLKFVALPYYAERWRCQLLKKTNDIER